MKNERGVTLLELIVVWVIIAIGATLMVPQIGTWFHHYRLGSAAREIASTLRLAQVEAVTRNTQHRVVFNPDTRVYVLQRDTGGGNWVDERSLSLPQTIGMKDITLAGNTVLFSPNSTASAGSLKVYNLKGTEKRITVATATGRIRIE